MKLFFDFFPVLLFFIAYKFAGIYTATAVAMIAALVQTFFFRFKNKKFEVSHLVTLGIISLLGGATLIWHDEVFIKWKPTIINWAFAIAFLYTQLLGKTPLIQHLIGNQIELPSSIWRRLNWAWIVFFLSLGVVNLYVAQFYSTDAWVNFKLFGMLGLTLVFAFAQAIYLSKATQEKTLQS